MLIHYMTGDIISLLMQIAGLLLTIQYAIYRPKKVEAIIIGVIMMSSANYFGQLCFAGEGPGFCAGIILLPLYGAIAAGMTIKIVNRRQNPSQRV